jgi:tetratricopeptide (TPR) repeat protein
VRINAQLIDAASGHHLWADRYDRQLTDVFVLQDEVTQMIVSALAVKLTADEEERLSQAAKANPEAYDTLLRGLELFRRFTLETHVQAREFFEKAVALDPTFARAYADLSLTLGENVAEGWTDAPGLSNQRSLEVAQHALALDDSLPVVHFALSAAYSYLKRHDEGIAAAQRAVELDSNYADGYAQLAVSLNYAGRPEAGLAAIRKAMRLNPRRPFYYVWILGQSHFFMGRTEQAAAQFEKVVESNPHFPPGHLSLAAAYGVLDRVEDAEWEAEEVLTLLPDLTLERVRQSDSYRDPAHMDLYVNGLRKAGLP